MNLMTLFLISPVLSGSAFAVGGVHEDPLIASLNAQFKSARVPTLEDLQPGKKWECSQYSAMHGDYLRLEGEENYYQFSALGAVLRNAGRSSVKAYAFADYAVVGLRDEFRRDYIRVTEAGDLISEWIWTGVSGADFPTYATKEISVTRANPDGTYTDRVITYSICPLAAVE